MLVRTHMYQGQMPYTSLHNATTRIDTHNNLANMTSAHNTATNSTTAHTTPFIRSYSNTFTILPSSIAFTPSPKSKPLPPFSTQGIVIGQSTNIQAESNTIYTDEYGRVKVKIHCFANQEEIDNTLYATHSLDQTNTSTTTHSTTQQSLATHSLHSTPKETNPQESLRISKQTNPPYCYSYSPFLRVSTPIASNHSGLYHTPRVGDEVIISYMDNIAL